MIAFLRRLFSGSSASNTLNVRTVKFFFQKSPDKPSGDVRGIDGLDFRVMASGALVQQGRTGADGKIDLRIMPGGVELQLLFKGTPVASYAVKARDAAIEAATSIDGQQRRLRMLGYHLGRTGADGDGVDNSMNVETDHAILQFQADQSIDFTGVVDAGTQTALTTQAGA
ncbi:MAG: peptidoglycan-binding protein [Phycisphaeraceae bacterium]|nr:peptidoglycan-binding protein [Phycisphaeraceae bacterium]